MDTDNSDTKLLPSRPSLLDSLAHGALLRALTCLAQNNPARQHAETVYCIDATAGNGHDTCILAKFLLELQTDIELIACDIQEQALIKTQARLTNSNLSARLFLCGHETIFDKLPPDSKLAGAIFNLGYLPNKDRKNPENFIITKAETSLHALGQFCERLLPQGCISIHCYTGHTGGSEEYETIDDFVSKLEPKQWRVLKTRDHNRTHSTECLFLLEKLQIKQQNKQ